MTTDDPQQVLNRAFEIVWLPRSEGLAQAEIDHSVLFRGFIVLEHMGQSKTRFTYTYQADLHNFAMIRRLVRDVDIYTVIHHRAIVKSLLLHFQQRLPLAVLTNDDARLLGDALFAIRSGRSMLLPAVTVRVSQRMMEYRALEELVSLYPWLPTMLAAVLRNKLRRRAPVAAQLAQLTTEEAARIGDGLGALLMMCPNAQTAVDEWLLQSVAMGEMRQQHPWFVPLIEQIAERLLTLVGHGLKLRLAVCALLTYGDVLSDAMVIRQYFAGGQIAAAQMSIAFIGANVVLQIIISVAQNFRNLKATALEVFFTLIFLKLLLEVLRIARGEQRKRYQTFSPLTENNYAKVGELFSEAGPGSLLQLFVVYSMAQPAAFQFLSIFSSMATAAFTITSIDYGLDTDPKVRASDPLVYGLVPDKSAARAYVFLALVVGSFAQMAAVVLATVSLAHVHLWIAVGAWSGKLTTMYAVKLARRDLGYFQPIRGPVGIVASVLHRACLMLISDLGIFASA
jgi:hypothetical protein